MTHLHAAASPNQAGVQAMNNLRRDEPARFVRRLAVCMSCIAAFSVAACNRDVQSARDAQRARSASENGGWPGYSNTYDGQRYAAFDQINTGNVAQLKTVCELKLGEEGPFQTGPVVVGVTMFLTTAHTTVAICQARALLRRC